MIQHAVDGCKGVSLLMKVCKRAESAIMSTILLAYIRSGSCWNWRLA
jgi:hypothetical protein